MALRASGLPGVEPSGLARWRGKEGTLKEGGVSDSAPDEGALETGVGLRIVNETFEVAAMVVDDREGRHYVIH